MFTGIVTHCAPIRVANSRNGVMRVQVEVPHDFPTGLQRGASVSINGVCLTVVDWGPTFVDFDVIDETLRRTNLGSLDLGDMVNLERAAKFGDEIGGHLLSGHIHTQAQVLEIQHNADNVAIHLELDETWAPYVLTKGYIAINGCSLTLGKVDNNHFWLHLIPETLRITNLKDCQQGSWLNVEIDHQTLVIVDTVNRYLNQHPPATRSSKPDNKSI
jgi:riboflavin synthase